MDIMLLIRRSGCIFRETRILLSFNRKYSPIISTNFYNKIFLELIAFRKPLECDKSNMAKSFGICFPGAKI